MSGKKGMGHRNWTKAEKLSYVLKHLDEHVALKKIARESGIPTSRIAAWVKKYLEEGEEGLSGKSGNKFAALTTSKKLTEVERLRLLVAKQEIEIARLKKGYFVCCGIRRSLSGEYEIVEELKVKYPVNFLCKLIGLNRSGYYKWRERLGKKNFREKRREEIIEKIKEAHKKYPSHAYHRLARDIKTIMSATIWYIFVAAGILLCH